MLQNFSDEISLLDLSLAFALFFASLFHDLRDENEL